MLGTNTLPSLCLLFYCCPLPTTEAWEWVLLAGVTVPRVTLCKNTPRGSSKLPLYLQSSRCSWRVPPVLPEAASEKYDLVVGKPPMSIPADSPAINHGLLTIQMTARLTGSGERHILFTLSDWKRRNSESLADRLWKERTICGGQCFLVFCGLNSYN